MNHMAFASLNALGKFLVTQDQFSVNVFPQWTRLVYDIKEIIISMTIGRARGSGRLMMKGPAFRRRLSRQLLRTARVLRQTMLGLPTSTNLYFRDSDRPRLSESILETLGNLRLNWLGFKVDAINRIPRRPIRRALSEDGDSESSSTSPN